MTDGQQIREQMWDYVYGLLTEEESQEMVARIKSDPKIARLYAEVRLKGELVAQAALVEDSSLQLKADQIDEPKVTREPTTPSPQNAAAWHQQATQLIAMAAGILIVVLGTGLCWPRPNERALAQKFVATDVVVSESLPGGVSNQLALHTYHINPAGEAAENASAEVQLRLVDSSGKEQFQKTLQTDASGQANVEIPGAALEPGARLEVSPSRSRAKGQIALATDLPVEAEPEITYFLSKEPVAQSSGDEAVSTWNFAAFSAKPLPESESQATALADELRTRDAEQPRGGAIVNGYQQQTNRAAGRMMAGQASPKSFAKQETAAASPPQVVEAGQPLQVDIPPQLADKALDIAVLCRGVTVASSSENETANKENNLDQAKLADRKAKAGQRQVTVPLPPEADGLMEVEVFDQASDNTEPLQRTLVYREPLKRLVVELPDFHKQVAPGDDVELKLHVVDEQGQSAANARLGVRVWNERLVQQLGDRPLLLTDAVLKGQGFEYGQNAALATNQVAQESDLGRLKQQANTYQRRMRAARTAPPSNPPAENAPAAGALVQSRSLNESQQLTRADATTSTKIELASNRDAVKLAIRTAADHATASRERAMRILGGVAVFGGIAVLLIVAALAAMKITASARVFVVPLITAIASLLIGVFWLGGMSNRSLPPIARADLARTQSSPATDIAAAHTDRPATADLRRESQSQPVGGPASSVAATPAQTTPGPGTYAVSPGGAPSSGNTASAANAAKPSEPESLRLPAPGAAPGAAGGFGASSSPALPARALAAATTNKAAAAEKKDADKDLNRPAEPASLYFDPNLVTDANGNANIRFQMPSVPCEYRLLIDALGHGRIGSRQELLIGGAPGE
jgi:hypothetical protein